MILAGSPESSTSKITIDEHAAQPRADAGKGSAQPPARLPPNDGRSRSSPARESRGRDRDQDEFDLT